MTRKFIVFCFFALSWFVPLSAIGDAPNSSPQQWEIGLQGNFPLWGGLSAKYTGFGRLHLQVIEHYVQNGDEYSAMVGLQTPIVVARHASTKVYLVPGVGVRKDKQIQRHFIFDREAEPGQPSDFTINRTVLETIVGSGFLIGLEFFLDNIFSSSNNSRYGFNIEFGQGFGQVDRDVSCEDSDGKTLNCADYDGLEYLREDPQ